MRDFFDVALAQTGIPKGVFSGTTAWIEVAISTPGGTFEIQAPRTRMVSVPYAFFSSSASFAGNASFATNSGTATFATNAGTATFAQSATTASFLLGGAGGGAIPIGGILPYAGSTAPNGFRLCDGSEVSRTGTFADLFVVISTSFGAGDGSTTFNLPDLRGRFPLGADNMGGTSADRVTATQADNLGQGAGHEGIPFHGHGVNDPGHRHGPNTGNSADFYWMHRPNTARNVGTGNNSTMVGEVETGSASTGIGIQNTGDSNSQNNLSPYQTVNYIIKF